jgi:hypothetical protein
MGKWQVVLAAGFLLACESVPGESADAGDARDAAQSRDAGGDDGNVGDAGNDGGRLCEPGAVLGCEQDVLAVCADDGSVTQEVCLLGCSEEGVRCLDVDPVNGLGEFLDDAEAGPALELTAGSIINVSTGTVHVGGVPVPVQSSLLDAPPGGVQVRVFPVRSLLVSGDVEVVGATAAVLPAIALVSHGPIAIQGRLKIGRAGAGLSGAGSSGVCKACAGENGACSGRGGGGFGSRGGDGGDSGVARPGGSGGAAVGSSQLVPLRGGGPSGSQSGSSSGRGGGAIQLVSRQNITISAGGVIDAGGERGLGAMGGGAGGGILLEAPIVSVVGAGSALAAGGGGGGCSGTVLTQAEDGRPDGLPAAGCVSQDSGNGGAGGAAQGLPGDGAGDIDPPCPAALPAGGGGGGGRGRIRINTATGTFAAGSGAIVSPQASVGALAAR